MSSYNYLDTIRPDEVETASKKARADIAHDRRIAANKRIIADRLKGQYITKRLEPMLQTMFPGAVRAYLSQSYERVEVNISYSANNYYDRDCITLCKTDNRHIDAAAMIESAENQEQSAAALEASLKHIETMVAAYNGIVADYATIHSDLKKFLNDIPYADYTLEREYNASLSPERFEQAVTA